MAIDREEFKIEPEEDDGMSAVALTQHLEDDTKRKQNALKSEFEEMGERYLKDIDRKKKGKSCDAATTSRGIGSDHPVIPPGKTKNHIREYVLPHHR